MVVRKAQGRRAVKARRSVNASEQELLNALQFGIPLDSRPFARLADELGCLEEDVIAFVERCRADGIVRRFGAVFDTRRLGYRSVLCAAQIPAEGLEAAAAAIVPLDGVTHCYVREPFDLESGCVVRSALPNLWFTLSYPADVFEAMADEVRARLSPEIVTLLPATRRYKVDVVFGAATRVRDESVADDVPTTALDRAVIRAMQDDTEVRKD